MEYRFSPEVRSNFLPRTRQGCVRDWSVAPIIAFSIALLCFIAAPAARADSCAPNTTGPFNWNDPASWICSGPNGSIYPGEKGPDTASLCVVSAGVTANVVAATPFPVTTSIGACIGGTLNINSGGALTIAPTSFVDAVNVSGGTFAVSSGGFATANGHVALSSGTITLNGGLDIPGPGVFWLHGGTINGSGALTIWPATDMTITGSAGPMTISGARIDCLAPLNYTSANTLAINNGAKLRLINASGMLFIGGSGAITTNAPATSSVTIQTDASLTANAAIAIQAPLNTEFNATVTANAPVQLTGGGTHFGKFIAQAAPIVFSGIHTFGGSTTFTAASAPPAFEFTGAASQFNITQNQLTIPGLKWTGGTIGGGQVLDLTGTNVFGEFSSSTWAIGSGTTVQLSSESHLSLGTATNIAGPGTLELGLVFVTVNGSPNVISAPVTIGSPSFTFGPSAQIDFTGGGTINSGTFATTGMTQTFRFGGPFLVHSATFQGPGAFVIPAGGTFVIDGVNGPVAFVGTPGSSRLFLLGGRMVFRDAVTSVDVSGFEIRVDSPGVMEFQNDVSLTTSASPATLFMNGGTLQKTGGTFTSSVYPAFTNGGTVIAQSGTLDFGNGYTQTGGRTRLAGGTVAILGGAGSFTLNSGYLEGNGTFQGSVTNSPGGIISPGLSSPPSTGIITITGSYSQTGALQIKLAGTLPGAGYDRLNVTGPSATIGGGLGITYVSPFTSPNGQAYDVFTSASPRSGMFSITNYPAPAAAWKTNYLPNAAQIVMTQADVSVTKSGPASVTNGQNIDYTVTVTNNDPTVTATNINIDDTFIGPAAFSNVIPGAGVTCLAPPPSIPPQPPSFGGCSIASLAPGASASIIITLTTTGPGTVSNTATVSGSEVDPNTSNNSATAAVTVNPAVDLAVAISDSPDPVLAGANATYTINITNNGLDASTNEASLTLTLTGGTIASLSGPFTCSNTATTATCTMPSIASAGIGSMTLVATAGTTAAMSLTATASDPNETNTANDTGSQSTVINAAADLSVSQSASPTTIFNGQSSVITIVVANNGPSTATAVPLTGTVTGSATITSASTAAGTCTVTGLTVDCSITSLASGASATVTINVSASASGTITGSASLPTALPPLAQTDPNSANNTAAPISITVNAASDLSMVITPPPVVNAGQNCTFSAVISNAGPDAAASFTATFTITGGTMVSAGSPVTCTTSASTATCAGSSLAGGATVTVSVVVTAGVSGSISLGGTLSSPSDPNGSNNATSSGAVVISPTADMTAAQSGPASVLQNQNATVVVTVSNTGPSASTNITLTDSFTNGVLVSATPSQGTCSGSPTITCSLGTLASGASATLTLVLTATGVSPLTNSASVSAAEFDPATSNNTAAPLAVAVNPVADLSVTQTGPASVYSGQNAVLTIVVKNNGPAGATNVTLTGSFTGGTLISATTTRGSCSGMTPLTCSIGALGSGETAVINVTLYAGTTGIQSTAGVSAAEADPAPSNNTSTLTIAASARADVSLSKSGPASASPGATITYSITLSNAGPSTATDISVTDPTPIGLTLSSVSGACTALPCTIASLNSGESATISASFTVASGGTAPAQITNTATAATKSDPNPANDSSSVTTSIACTTAPPKLVAPLAGVVTSPVTFSWEPVANATTYEVFVVQDGKRSLGTTAATSLIGMIGTGAFSWYVVASTSDCGPLTSGSATLNACNRPDAPLASVVANAASGQSYVVEWASVIGASGYEIQEATNSDFTGATAKSVTATSVMFSHTAAMTSQPYFYRVRGVATCDPQLKGAWSIVIRVVIAPIPTQLINPNANVPAGSTMVVIQDVPIPGIDDGHSYSFSASVDRPWMSVSPSSGILPPSGVILQISADPTSLTNGTFTGTLIVAISPVSGTMQTTATTSVSVPISVNLVTPVTPTTATTTPASALVIPSVGHLDGINSLWQSDVRVANASSSKQQYLLTFTPTSNQASVATTGVKQTTITIDGGSTVALDDIARNWFGIGSLGEAANGVLMIRSLDALHVSTPLVSSRTYSVSSSGTFGQYIPAIPFSSFITAAAEGALPAILSLQQIAQSDAFRTNLGLVEAGGKQATVTLSVFDAAGRNLRDIPLTIEAFQQLQLNSFLASNGIALADGRIEVKVTSGGGKVTAYASVVDNKTSDPLLVSGVPLTQPLANRYVLPGVADLDNGLASWRSDVRIFNGGTAPHSATFTLYPLGGSTPLTATLLLNPGEIKLLDGAVKSLFAATNVGGALHISTPGNANLIVTGRTYNAVTGGGTFGQFIPAVTATDAVGAADRALQILQVEDSTRYRTNLGIAEVTGQPATAEISIHLPDSKATPIIEIPLNAYEYRQMPIIQNLGLGNVYNVRVSVKVTSGGGKVTAYGSVIDQQTQDPTYVPAQ